MTYSEIYNLNHIPVKFVCLSNKTHIMTYCYSYGPVQHPPSSKKLLLVVDGD